MEELEENIIKSYTVNLDTFDSVALELDDMVGVEHARCILKGNVPIVNKESGEIVDFRELLHGNHYYQVNKSHAYLFTGRCGNGKHTIDSAYAYYVRDYLDYENFFYLSMDVNELSAELKNKEIKDVIKIVMKKIWEISRENEEQCIYLSLGDITPCITSKKLCKLLSKWIRELTSSTNIKCILTAYFDDSVEVVPDILAKEFIILHLDSPTEKEREKYFSEFLTDRECLKFGKSNKEMAEMTQDFTYGMLRQICEQFFMLLKWKLRVLEKEEMRYDICQYIDFYENDTEEAKEHVIEISAGEIDEVISLIRRKKRKTIPQATFVRENGQIPDLTQAKHDGESKAEDKPRVNDTEDKEDRAQQRENIKMDDETDHTPGEPDNFEELKELQKQIKMPAR